MKKIIILLAVTLTGITSSSFGQIYYTKNGRISFFSKTSFEDITADNNQVISVLNTEKGVIEFSALNNAFHFQKAKMEDDFNESYIESGKYPKSTFKGNIADMSAVNLSKDGSYKVTVNGDLTIHGVSKNISSPATINIKDGKISGTATFKILLKDYNIKIPSIMSNKIAESIELAISCNYEKK